MKKVLSFLFITLSAALLTAGYFIFDRYQRNPEQIFPYPYRFETSAPAIELDAPILITGDRMGVYFAKYQAELADTISVNLAKPIKIQSIAKAGHGLHRTLHELRSLVQWPQILIYQGASEEFMEQKFQPDESSRFKANVKLYQDDRIETALILYPVLSRVVYDPMKPVVLTEVPELLVDISEEDYLKRLETELLLYEQQLIQLVNMSRDRNTLLILTTTPINLDIAPRRICEFTSTIELEKDLADLAQFMKADDPKSAYTLSSKLQQQHAGNAQLLYQHGQIAKRMGKLDEARTALIKATAYDCEPWRATEVYNSIIRKVARDHQVILFDFASMLESEWSQNITFFDELYPQNLYYEQGMKQLGNVIKEILKL
jgi:hypothetical protein